MILYHGSNIVVSEPKILVHNRFLDFGSEFYTTTNKAQAIGFAEKVTLRRKNGTRTVSIYDLTDGAFTECSVLRFEKADEMWLDFVLKNRSGYSDNHAYDIIIGPVANDDVYTTVVLYTAGLLTKEQALNALRIKKLYNQVVPASDRALSYLSFIGTIFPEESV